MAGSSGFSNILGTLSSIFRIGLNGPAWKSNASKLLASNNDGTALVNVQVLEPVDAFDAANKGYVDNVGGLLVSQTREITTVEGIQGGGLLDDDLELKLDVNGLANLSVVDPAADSVLVYDNSAGVHKKALISSLPGGTEAADIAAEEAARAAADAALAAADAVLAAAIGAAQIHGIAIYQEQQASGTHAGTFTAGAWRTRLLNTEVSDAQAIGAIASNQVTLGAGTYFALAWAPVFDVGFHQAQIYDATNAAILAIGSTSYAAGGVCSPLTIVAAKFTLAGTAAIELQNRCSSTASTVGFGYACSFGTEGYSTLVIIKLSA